jgi:hypothetical protein
VQGSAVLAGVLVAAGAFCPNTGIDEKQRTAAMMEGGANAGNFIYLLESIRINTDYIRRMF